MLKGDKNFRHIKIKYCGEFIYQPKSQIDSNKVTKFAKFFSIF